MSPISLSYCYVSRVVATALTLREVAPASAPPARVHAQHEHDGDCDWAARW